MVLRITKYEGSDSGAILRLDGRLITQEAALLERECAALLGSRDGVSLDLVGVSFVDRAGIKALKRLRRAGAEIRCPSGPVASVLLGAGVRLVLDAEPAAPRSRQ